MITHYIWKNGLVQTSIGNFEKTQAFLSKDFPITGVFTTFSVLYSKNRQKYYIWGLEKHIERLFVHSSKAGLDLNLNFNINDIFINSLLHLLKQYAETLGELKIRLSNIDGQNIILSIDKLESMPEAFHAITVKASRPQPELKTFLSREISEKANKIALSLNADEAFLIDENDILREGAWSNIFWFDQTGSLFTTADKILNGITRELIITITKCSPKNCLLNEICSSAGEVFVTKSTRGIIPVSSLNGKQIGKNTHRELTTKLINKFNSVIEDCSLYL